MSSKESTTDTEPKRGITPEQVGLLVVMAGVVLMVVGVYTTEEIFGLYFNIGLGLLVLGSCLFALFIWARGYELAHMPIPLPDVVRDMLRNGTVRRDQSILTKSGYSPRPEYQGGRTAATQPLYIPGPAAQSEPAPNAQPAAAPVPGFSSPQPFQAPPEPAAPAPAPTPAPTAPEPQPAPEPATVPAPPVQPPEPAKPEPKKEQYMDVLEEADKEFESYIDKLIEE